MTPERLASMWQHAIAYDRETALIQPGLLAPPPVLGSAAEYNHLHDIYLDALQKGDQARVDAIVAHYGPMVKQRFIGQVINKTDCRALFRQMLNNRQTVICGANIAFDFLVEAVDFATTLGEDIMPELFDAYDPDGTIVRGKCNGRVFEIQLAEPLHAIANGHLGKHARTERPIINKKTGRPGRYSLDTVTYEVTGREDAKANDRFRLDYWIFNDVPLNQIPFEAKQYPIDDACNTLEDALAQVGFLPSAHAHEFDMVGNAMICRHCGRAAANPETPQDCMRRVPHRNLHDLARQAYAAWALHLGAAWGFNIDQAAVDKLEKKYLDLRKNSIQPFIDAGIVRADDTENQSVLKRLVAIAYGARHECQVCASTYDKKGRKLPGKVLSPKTGNTYINCEACDGTALQLPAEVPRSDKGGIGKGRDVLQESGDELLMAYGEQEGEKILSTYVPLLRGGRACNVCGDTGAGKYPHKDWCTAKKGEAGYRSIALTLSPNTLVETGRCSYERGIHGLPRKGGVRECIVARPGYVLSSEDFTAGELVTHAQNCLEMVGYSKLADALNNDLDAHLALAGTMLGKHYDEMKSIKSTPLAKDNRQAAKGANFGFPGGMAELTFVLRKRSDPDLFTPCENGPDVRDGVRGYKGMRPCILMDGYDRCGIVKITSYNDNACPPVCELCVKAAKRLREFWFEQWPENNPKDGYFAIIKKLINTNGPSGKPELVHPVSLRIRGGVGFCDGANGLFQGRLSDAAKNAYCQIVRECYDKTWRVRSSEMMESKYADGPSPLLGSRAIMLAHDESIIEHPEDMGHDGATRASEIMVESLRFMCPRMKKACKADPTLMRFLAKGAEPVYVNGRLVPWEPKQKAA